MSFELRNLMKVLWDKNLSCFSSSCVIWSYKRYNPFPVGLTVLGYNRLLRMEVGQKRAGEQQTWGEKKNKKSREGKTMAQTNCSSWHNTVCLTVLRMVSSTSTPWWDFSPRLLTSRPQGSIFWRGCPGELLMGSCLQEAGRKLDLAQVMLCASRRSKDMKALKEGLSMHICGRLWKVQACCSMGGQQAPEQMRKVLSLTGSVLSGSVLRLSSSSTSCQSLGEWSTHDTRKSVRMWLKKKMSPWNCTGYSWLGWGSNNLWCLKSLSGWKRADRHHTHLQTAQARGSSEADWSVQPQLLEGWWSPFHLKVMLSGHQGRTSVPVLHRQLMPLKGESKLL